MAVVSMGCLAALASPFVQARPALGWQVDPYFVEVEANAIDETLHRVYVPRGESAETWTERITLFEQGAEPDSSPRALLDARGEHAADRCADFDQQAVTLPASAPAYIAASLWHCPFDRSTGDGWVKSVLVLQQADRATFMEAEGRYPKHEKSSFPLRKDQAERWWAMQFSLGVCDAWFRPGCQPDAKTLVEGAAASLGPEEQHAIDRIAARGRELYYQDQMAWHATDFALQTGLIDPTIKGHFLAVPNPSGGGYVYFIRDPLLGKPRARRVAFDTEGNLSADAEETGLDPDVAMRYRALKTAKSSKQLKFCGGAVNSAVLADDEGKGWLVYLMSATPEPGRMMLGGHNRVKVSQDGKRVLSVDYSAKSCLSVDTGSGAEEIADGEPAAPEGDKLEYVMVTHLVSEQPWETQVMQSLTFERSMIVITAHAAWRVRGDQVERVKLDADPEATAPAERIGLQPGRAQ
ncbi:MAG: hypothetical protein KDJ14_17535 [Xanthomonadales bacterium]|nr:hypothetical protein [Xanthomonadales bacterium]